MQELFDEKKNLLNYAKQTSTTLYEKVCDILISELEDIKLIYNLNNNNTTLNTHILSSSQEIMQSKLMQIGHTFANNQMHNYIFSPLYLHRQNNLNAVLSNVSKILAPKGLFMGTFFGVNNMLSLGQLLANEDAKYTTKQIARMMPLLDLQNIGKMLLTAGFENVVVQSTTLNFNFQSLKEALYFIKDNGESSSFKFKEQSLLSGNILKKTLDNFKYPVNLELDICVFSCFGR